MTWVEANIKWIMIVSGVLTCTMLFAAVAPQAALRSTFGETLEGPLAEVILRPSHPEVASFSVSLPLMRSRFSWNVAAVGNAPGRRRTFFQFTGAARVVGFSWRRE